MPKLVDLTGQRIGRLTVIRKDISDNCGKPMWLCLCRCGKEKVIHGSNLRSGHTRSCGCLRNELTASRSTTHGQSRKDKEHFLIYQVWKAMNKRCTNSRDQGYKNYGGRGIMVCERWSRFENFLKDMGQRPTSRHSIDRIDNNGNYSPSNCRWVTYRKQSRNTRRNHLIQFQGKTQCIADWAQELGMGPSTIGARIGKLGWSIEKALTTPVRKRRKGK